MKTIAFDASAALIGKYRSNDHVRKSLSYLDDLNVRLFDLTLVLPVVSVAIVSRAGESSVLSVSNRDRPLAKG